MSIPISKEAVDDFIVALRISMMASITGPISVFYGGQYCGTYASTKEIWTKFDCPDSDIYQGGVLYWPHPKHITTPWFNMDLTPIIPAEVDAKLKLLVLILSL